MKSMKAGKPGKPDKKVMAATRKPKAKNDGKR